jgi:uncharacterized protein (TIGR02246 family)
MLRPALALLLLATLAGPARPADFAVQARPEAVAERFIEAWNAHAPHSFGIVLVKDADWVTASGIVLRGRDDIVGYLGREHETWARDTRMTAVRIHSRLVSRHTVVVRLEWEISDAATSFPGVTQFVVTRSDGEWRVASGQVTSGRGRAAR